ncbi:minor capsid protein [Thalassobaculum sp. OXR-137]|uniref:minor capsid protein n=1 Tax=Thalassobaculum sp. OXR-137 TaxID=3100173 RepID=UPI002AC993F4|nr:minor capsid protein [Thalassobaculum sp. OXR-137]WPZ32233.1 minor capsid protein [Thalassobaculum sp. OXR-137]
MADNVPTRLYDATVQRATRIERFKSGFVRSLIAVIDDTTEDLVDRICRSLEGSQSRTRLETMLRELRTLNADLKGALEEQLVDELEAFAQEEVARTAATLQRALPDSISGAVQFAVPSEAVLFTSADGEFKNTLVRGKTIQAWLDDLVTGDSNRIAQAVRLGFVEGQGIDSIVRRVRGTSTLRFRDGERALTKRQAEALVRTSIQAAATEARDRVYRANEPLIKGVRWVSTLDGRTSSICQSLDGKEFGIDDGPRPPSHFKCRSTVVPIIKSWRELGFDRDEPPGPVRPFLRSKRRLKDVPKPDRDALRGTVPGDLNYGDWLRKQPASFQDEVLGPTKAKLFRDGGLPIEKFRDIRMTSDFTLDELRQREPEAWRKAFE